MAAIHDLLAQIQDEALKDRINKEIEKLAKTKKFGLVFEDHLPECTPLYEYPVKKGANVALKTGKLSDIYTVLKVEDNLAYCIKKDSKEQKQYQLEELVCVAEFGEPIYPYLKPIDSICNAPDLDLWHTLIEADNYHALQLLEYLYSGKVDCIYIDPPYNTGAKDWKYNNDYVEGKDSYRHSKWLSMMQRRLKLAKNLLNPKDSVLIVTIDEKEYLHLGCLLEEMFPEAKMQMISIVINQNGSTRLDEFSRVNEYIFVLRIGSMSVVRTNDNMLSEAGKGIISRTWHMFSRTQTPRKATPKQFYPIFIDPEEKKIISIGDSLDINEDRNDVIAPDGQIAVFPLKNNGEEVTWGAIPSTAREFLRDGLVKVGGYDKKNDWWTIHYVRGGDRNRIKNGEIEVKGRDKDGSLILEYVDPSKRLVFPKTVWNRIRHDATVYGTGINANLMPDRKFPFPKSLYAVEDVLRFFISDKREALIVDFFAGSGTTLHAVNLLNAEDGGHRRCILVTNNEVSDMEEKEMVARGLKPGDEEWEKLGIARYITWPRTVCSIKGKDINGKALKGNYMGSDIPMAEGFKSNAIFFKLGFLDKTAVSLGMQFKELLPVLWMKAGAIGECPTLGENDIPEFLIFKDNKFAVLLDEKSFSKFEEEIHKNIEIQTVFLVTDYDVNYQAMTRNLGIEKTYQLYRDYLDNFRINKGRNNK